MHIFYTVYVVLEFVYKYEGYNVVYLLDIHRFVMKTTFIYKWT